MVRTDEQEWDGSAEEQRDSITVDELDGVVRPEEYHVAPSHNSPAARNAFTELMSRSPSARASKQQSKTGGTSSTRLQHPLNAVHGRYALGTYITSPEKIPSDIVISHDASFVAIHDAFPKASIHLLLLPRDHSKQFLHPFDALADTTFLAEVRQQADKFKALAASELRRKFTQFSLLDEERNATLKGDRKVEAGAEGKVELPFGRDWSRDIRVGVHAVPSMAHLHIHIISVDKFSPCLKHKRHYNSFATPFFVDLEDFPLAKDDPRRRPGEMGYLHENLSCWRCGKDFQNRFQLFKGHLETEFDQWKKI